MHFTNNDYASFGKVDNNLESNNVHLVNAICLHYTPTTKTFNHCQVCLFFFKSKL